MLGFKLPKDDSKYQWTNHVKDKMVYYRISESLIKRIVRFPKRKEIGIAPGTVAVMQPRVGYSVKRIGNSRNQVRERVKKTEEIWVMYKEVKSQENPKPYTLSPKRLIISTWRYPGISPVGEPIQIPDDVLIDIDAALAE